MSNRITCVQLAFGSTHYRSAGTSGDWLSNQQHRALQIRVPAHDIARRQPGDPCPGPRFRAFIAIGSCFASTVRASSRCPFGQGCTGSLCRLCIGTGTARRAGCLRDPRPFGTAGYPRLSRRRPCAIRQLLCLPDRHSCERVSRNDCGFVTGACDRDGVHRGDTGYPGRRTVRHRSMGPHARRNRHGSELPADWPIPPSQSCLLHPLSGSGGFVAVFGGAVCIAAMSLMSANPDWHSLPALIKPTELWKWSPGVPYGTLLYHGSGAGGGR